MRKLFAAAVPVAVLAFALVGSAGAHGGRGERFAKALGQVEVTVSAGQNEFFRFFAKDRGDAAMDRGKVDYRNATAEFSYRARVTCVKVDGSTARFGYVVPDSEGVPTAIRGLGIVVQVTDAGKSATTKDTLGYVSGAAALATACDTTAVGNAQPIMAGDLRVKPAGTTSGGKGERKHRKHRHDDDDD